MAIMRVESDRLRLPRRIIYVTEGNGPMRLAVWWSSLEGLDERASTGVGIHASLSEMFNQPCVRARYRRREGSFRTKVLKIWPSTRPTLLSVQPRSD
jgi:hypothetical protein